MKLKQLLLSGLLFLSANVFSQRFNIFTGGNLIEMRKVQFYQKSYSDPNAPSDLKIIDLKQTQMNSDLVTSGVLGLSYEYNGFILATGLGIFNSEETVFIAKWNGSDYENTTVSYDISGIYIPLYLYYSFWTLNRKRSFISAGLKLKYNYQEKETPNKDFSEMKNFEYYKYALMEETYYKHATTLNFRLGREKLKEGQTYSYGLELEIPTQKNIFYSQMAFSLFLEYRLTFAKKKKYSNVYINQEG